MSHSHGYRSSTSPHSRSESHLMNYIEEFTDAELIKQVNDIKQQIKILSLENEIFERVIMRLDPALMHGIQQALDYATKLQSNSSLNVGSFVKSQASRYGLESLMSPSRMLTSPSRVSTRRVESSGKVSGTVIFGTGPRINVLERSELVSTEMEILISNLEKARQKAAKQHALLKAQLEEIGIKETHIKKASEMFHQEVVVEGWDKIAQRIPAEIWIRFMTEWVKIADSHIGKFRLRTSTLNSQYSNLKGQIKVKAELSDNLRAVDFDKLKIENKECLETIDYKLQQLSELKKMTGDANLNLTVHKKAMMEQNGYLSNILNSIKEKYLKTVELDKERHVIKIQSDSLAQRLDDVKKVRLAYEVPDIMDYVSVKSEVADLKHSVKLLENRLHIQQIALASLHKKLKSLFINGQ
ncbi:coiled-coil domain-containing protein 113-like [Pararge aegeria]|uniref:Cilia- and flagella-associated protein 263 n=1 Tax=Pararge aegeria aegeria TaxID=348720 RepID=A0A8S4S7Z6_9NEOP|nr:coiled-coil domain-containing protein 113-like [Pararge aegeria]CAH2249644.1 jg18806 [Pararge aegeria aegeria]